MKQITDALVQRLAGEALTLCLLWRLTRQDGTVIGVTDHDSAVGVDGVTYEPSGAVMAGTFRQGLGLKPGRAGAGGVLSSDLITSEDLQAGLWNRARVDVYRCDWTAPELGAVPVWHGLLSEISQTESGAFEAELVSQKAVLEQTVGRVIQRRCDAELGDARCGLAADGRSCDKRFETCRDVFSNTVNFRGFAHLPGMEVMLAGPSGHGNSGGKR